MRYLVLAVCAGIVAGVTFLAVRTWRGFMDGALADWVLHDWENEE